MPADILFLAFSLWIYYNFHPHFIQIVRFVLVENFEFDFVVFESVRHFEEEPLWVAVGVYIVLKQQIVLLVTYLGYKGEVAALEAWFKD